MIMHEEKYCQKGPVEGSGDCGNMGLLSKTAGPVGRRPGREA
jgi:hypothetical protein